MRFLSARREISLGASVVLKMFLFAFPAETLFKANFFGQIMLITRWFNHSLSGSCLDWLDFSDFWVCPEKIWLPNENSELQLFALSLKPYSAVMNNLIGFSQNWLNYWWSISSAGYLGWANFRLYCKIIAFRLEKEFWKRGSLYNCFSQSENVWSLSRADPSVANINILLICWNCLQPVVLRTIFCLKLKYRKRFFLFCSLELFLPILSPQIGYL